MKTEKIVLLIDNDLITLDIQKSYLEQLGYIVVTSESFAEAGQYLEQNSVHLIVTDLRLRDDTDIKDQSGLKLAKTFAQNVPKIIQTSYLDINFVIEALKRDDSTGKAPAIDVISKSEGLEVLGEAIDLSFEKYVRLDTYQLKVGGALTFDDVKFYSERESEMIVIENINKMNYVKIIEPRQQGKTSLLNYITRHPIKEGLFFINIDVSKFQGLLENKWYREICSEILAQLQNLISYDNWPDIPETSLGWRKFLTQLAKFAESQKKKLVIALDEIGSTPFPGQKDFYNILREIYNARQNEPYFTNVTFILVGTFFPKNIISNSVRSPFNIAQRVRLPDFTVSQVQNLLSNFPFSEQKAKLLSERIHYWTSGQPYLTQHLTSYLELDFEPAHVDEYAERLCREESNHIPPLVNYIQTNPKIYQYINRIYEGEKIDYFPIGNPIQAELELVGFIKPDKDGKCIIRNPIYERIFSLLISLQPNILEENFSNKVDVRSLREILENYFSEEELRTLSFEMNLSYENFSGSNKAAKTREMIIFLEHRRQIDIFIERIIKLRPFVKDILF